MTFHFEGGLIGSAMELVTRSTGRLFEAPDPPAPLVNEWYALGGATPASSLGLDPDRGNTPNSAGGGAHVYASAVADSPQEVRARIDEIERLNDEATTHRNTLNLTRLVHSVPEAQIEEAERELARIEKAIERHIAALPGDERLQVVNGATGSPYTEAEWAEASANGLAAAIAANPAARAAIGPTVYGGDHPPGTSAGEAEAFAEFQRMREESALAIAALPDQRFDEVINWRTQRPYTEEEWAIAKVQGLVVEEQAIMEEQAALRDLPGGDTGSHTGVPGAVREELETRIAALPHSARTAIVDIETGLPYFTVSEWEELRLDEAAVADEVNATFGDGGASGALTFSEALRAATDELPPEQAAAVIERVLTSGGLDTALAPVVEDETRGFGSPESTAFIANLSAALASADDPALAAEVAALFPPMTSFDFSFRQAVANGHGADLLIALVQRFQVESPHIAHWYVEGSLEPGVADFVDSYGESYQTFIGHEAYIFYSDEHWGVFEQAGGGTGIDGYREKYAEDYEAYDTWARRAIELLDDAHGLLDADGRPLVDLGQRYELLESLPVMGSRTISGSQALAEVNARREMGESTFLDLAYSEGFETHIDDSVAYADYRTRLSTTIINATTAAAVVAEMEGRYDDADAYIAGLGDGESLFGVGTSSSRRAAGFLRTLLTEGRNGDRAATLSNKTDFDNWLDDLGVDWRIANSLRASSVILGGAGLAFSIQDYRNGGSPEDALLLLNSGIGYVAGASKESLEAWTAWRAAGASDDRALQIAGSTKPWVDRLGKVSALTGFVISGVDAFSAADAFRQGHFADGTFLSASAVGGGLIAHGSELAIGPLILSKAAITGIGAILVVGSAVAKIQYDRVKASNATENEDTELFIRAAVPAGTDPEIIRHLRNADSDGRNIGVFLQAASHELGLEPHELLYGIAELDPALVLELVESSHGVDPDGDSLDVAAYPLTHPSDPLVGQHVRATLDGEYHLVDSEGNWLIEEGNYLIPLDESLMPSLRNDRVNHNGIIEVVGPQSVTGWIQYAEQYLGVALS